MQNNRTYGFSLIEALVSLAVISVIAVMLSAVFSIGIKSIVKSRTTVTAAVKHLKIDTEIRNCIEKIRIPYWKNDFDFSVSDTALTAEWYEGKKDSFSVKLPSEITDVRYELIRAEDGRPAGCRIYYRITETEYHTTAVFASIPAGVQKL